MDPMLKMQVTVPIPKLKTLLTAKAITTNRHLSLKELTTKLIQLKSHSKLTLNNNLLKPILNRSWVTITLNSNLLLTVKLNLLPTLSNTLANLNSKFQRPNILSNSQFILSNKLTISNNSRDTQATIDPLMIKI